MTGSQSTHHQQHDPHEIIGLAEALQSCQRRRPCTGRQKLRELESVHKIPKVPLLQNCSVLSETLASPPEQEALKPACAAARGPRVNCRICKSRNTTTGKLPLEQASARLTNPLKRQAKCSKPPSKQTRGLKAALVPAPSGPARSAQLTAALGKSWTQAKLSFGKAVQSSNCQPSESVPPARKISTAEVKSEICSPIAANLPAAPVPIFSIPSTEQHLEGLQPGDTLTVCTWKVMGLTGV